MPPRPRRSSGDHPVTTKAITTRILKALNAYTFLSVSLGVMFLLSGVLKAASIRAGTMRGTVAWTVVQESELALVAIAIAEACLGVLLAWRQLRFSALIGMAVAVSIASATALATSQVGRRPCGCFGGLPTGFLDSVAGFILRNALVIGSLIWLAMARRELATTSKR